MKKKSFLVLSASLITSVSLGIGVIALWGTGRQTTLSSKAGGEYSCTLPGGQVELLTVINKAFSDARSTTISNPYSFRGTVTKRCGDYAFIQRVNQSTHQLDSIRIKGLNTYVNDIAEGNVVDFSGGKLCFDGGSPAYVLDNTVSYTIAFTSNPYGYTPTEYEGVDNYYDYIGRSITTQEQLDTYIKKTARLVKLIGVVPYNIYNKADIGNGEFYYYGYIKESSLSDNTFMFIIDSGNTSTDYQIALKFSGLVNGGNPANLINFTAVSYFRANKRLLVINSVNDIEETDISMIDSNVIQSRRSMNVYLGNLSSVDQLAVYTLKGNQYQDIPYVNAQAFINRVYGWGIYSDSSNRSLIKIYQDNINYLYNKNYGDFDFDVVNDTLAVYTEQGDIDRTTSRVNGVSYLVDGAEADYCSFDQTRTSTKVSFTQEIYYDFGKYGIDIVEDKFHNVYVPLVTLGHLILGNNGYEFAYNGKDYYFYNPLVSSETDEETTNYKNQFYDDTPWADPSYTTRSQAYANYVYGDLLFAMEYCYGLYDIRGVTDMDSYLDSLQLSSGDSLKDLLTSTSNYDYELGMAAFTGYWLYDGHAQYWKNSPYRDHSSTTDKKAFTNLYKNCLDQNDRYHQLFDTQEELEALRGENGPGLYIEQDTAVIRFDGFAKFRQGDSGLYAQYLDMFTYEELAEAGTDLLFRKAFNDIEANNADPGNTKIENVVFDLSLNGGGEVDVIPFLMAYVTAHPSHAINFEVRGEVSELVYKVDINYDGVVDENDTYEGKFNFYCLDSRLSFSCGNFFPSLLKGYGLAETIGESSGGGVCAVGAIATGAGTLLRFSSLYQLGYWNAAQSKFVCYEDGVAADATLARSNYYNLAKVREAVLSLQD